MDAQKRLDIWVVMFATVAAMKLHPGNYSKGQEKVVIDESADLADEMMSHVERRM